MKTVKVTDLRSHLPEYLGAVQRGEPLAVTSRGRVIVRILPAEDERRSAQALLRQLRATARVGDVVSPLGAVWEAERGDS